MKLKFRAWDENEKCFYYSDDDLGNFFSSFSYCDITQSTGLFDKKNKEIYHKDVVDIRHWDDLKFEVSMEPTQGVTFNRVNYQYGEGNDISDPIRIDWDRIEVVGNIYENPELLK